MNRYALSPASRPLDGPDLAGCCWSRLAWAWLAYCLCAVAGGCDSPPPLEGMRPPSARPQIPLATREILARFEAPVDAPYHLDSGDRLTVEVWERPELTGPHVVGPDGIITLPLVGPLRIARLTRAQAAEEIALSLARYYVEPVVTVRVDEYLGNRVTVLGPFESPGTVRFDHAPTILDALAGAGGLEDLERGELLTRCAVIRGRDRVAWIDLDALLTGRDLSLNLRLRPGDTVFVPEAEERYVYVLGHVEKPGAYRLHRRMTVVDAIAAAGGVTKDANLFRVCLCRPDAGQEYELNFFDITGGREEVNIALAPEDIVYVPSHVVAKVGYLVEKVTPLFGLFVIGQALGQSL